MSFFKNIGIEKAFLICGFFTAISSKAQVNPRIICRLPNATPESSGLIYRAWNRIYTHNDSGNPNQLFKIDTLGHLLKTIVVANAANIDWEDITQDENGNVYIGDFGNNDNNRTNLCIYQIGNPDTLSGDTIYARRMSFRYASQTMFPPQANKLEYDCESMIFFNDSIHIFSKNRTNPFTGYVKHYKLPVLFNGVVQVISPVDSFYCGPGPKDSYYATGAALSPDKSRLVLMSYQRMYVFSGFTGSKFFSGNAITIPFSTTAQREGVSFDGNDRIYISDERIAGMLGNLAVLDIQLLINSVSKDTIQSSVLIYKTLDDSQSFLKVSPSIIDHVVSVDVYGFDGRKRSSLTHPDFPVALPLEHGIVCVILRSGRVITQKY